MSKSPNLIIPAAGGLALMIGVAYGVASRDYGADKIERLEQRAEAAEEQAGAAAESASAAAARAAELDARIAEIQAEAELRLASGGTVNAPAPDRSEGYGLGRAALPEEIAAWDVDVLPDGRGLPEGRGDVWTGEEVFSEKCAACHGEFAEGVGNWPVLAGGFDTLDDRDPVKTVGSYWPHLSTVWDYVHRSMPFGAAQTLTDDEVYAITAYILYSNNMVGDDFELSHENFTEVSMYNADGFFVDDRAEAEYPVLSQEPCMEGCKESVEITKRASFLDVTPDTEEAAAEAEEVFEEASAAPAAVAETVTAAAGPDPALVAEGEKGFRKCAACHQIGEGAKNRSGPHLNGVVGRTIGGVDGFRYSGSFQSAADEGRVWDEDSLSAFLAAPRDYMSGTKMSFAGLKSEDEIDAMIAYLRATGG